MSDTLDAIVIGGGFFGCRIAQYLRGHLDRVVLVEKDGGLLQRASYANQARVHQGYHYPRSLLTAIRSRVNFNRFIEEYPESVDGSFTKYYGIGRQFSHVTARQFSAFCKRIGAPIEPASKEVRRLFDFARIEDVFLVQEWAFDAAKLKEHVLRDLRASGVEVRYRTRATRVSAMQGQGLVVDLEGAEGPEQLVARRVLNCTYTGINDLLGDSQIPIIPLKHEATEMALVEPPPEIKSVGITVMCGPFFSIMPFPPRGLHSLSHVRYTPHYAWLEQERVTRKPNTPNEGLTTNYERMIRDSARYIPCLRECVRRDSIWEVKTILPASERDDSRPILFRPDHGIQGLFCIMGGKIDNVYDVIQELDTLRAQGRI